MLNQTVMKCYRFQLNTLDTFLQTNATFQETDACLFRFIQLSILIKSKKVDDLRDFIAKFIQD